MKRERYAIYIDKISDNEIVDYLKNELKMGQELVDGQMQRFKHNEDIFDEIYSGALFIADRILLSHEPVDGLSWCLNIHGHDHSNSIRYEDGCNHLNLAANVCGYTPVSLGKIIKDGVLSGINDIHRMAIDKQIKGKERKE